MKPLFYLSLTALLAVAHSAFLYREDSICDPIGANWVPYTGYRIQRYASLSVFPEPLRTTHAIELYHCFRGRVNYVATAEVPPDSDVAWGVNICGPALKPGQKNPFPAIPQYQINIEQKVISKSWWNALLINSNPFHNTPISNLIKQKWISSDSRKNLYNKARKKVRFLENLNKREMQELQELEIKVASLKGETVSEVVEKAIAKIYLKISETTNAIEKAKNRMQSLERFLNKGLPVADERALGAYGYNQATGRGQSLSDTSDKWRGHVIDLIKLSYASIGQDHTEEKNNKAKPNYSFDKSAYRSYGSYLSNPSLSRLSSEPLNPNKDTPGYCFRVVRSKRYYYNKMDFFFPYTTVGGLFMCPAYGVNCTNENAIPVMPLRADNFMPVSSWGSTADFKTSQISAKRAREASHTTSSALLIWLGELAKTLTNTKDDIKLAAKTKGIDKLNSILEKNVTELTQSISSKVKKGFGTALSYFDDTVPVSISLRRSYVKRVPFLYTQHSDFKPKYMKKGVVWPKWAKKLDVNEMYLYDYNELRAIEMAIRENLSTVIKHVGIWKQLESFFNMIHKSEFMDYEEEDNFNQKKSKSLEKFSKIDTGISQSIKLLDRIRKWTLSTVFSINSEGLTKKANISRRKLLKMIKEIQKPWDELGI